MEQSASESPVRLRAVSKSYRLYERPLDRLLEWVGAPARGREVRALDGVSLDVPAGSVLGIIGENGAGKSTLLKIVAGVSEASSGDVDVRGRVASILELGAGFHGEFTGRENARLNAAILGVAGADIPAMLERVRQFSDLGEFFDRPVRTYSSGMVMRLAFTVATEVDPEVLVIDEALAVGDGRFQKKCVDRITDFRSRGRTILFCSHAMYFVTTLCDRAVWLSGGRIVGEGAAPEVVRDYENFLLERSAGEKDAPTPLAADPAAPREAWIESARILDRNGRECRTFAPGSDVGIEVVVASLDRDRGLHLRVGIDRNDDVQVYAADSRRDGAGPFRGARRHRIVHRIPSLPVRSGLFSVFLYLGDEHALHLYDHLLLREAIELKQPGEFDVGLLEVSRSWMGESLDG